MVKRKDSNFSSETQQWKKIFESMSNMLQITARERQMYRDRLVSDAILYDEKISQLESEVVTLEKIRNVDALSSNLLLFMKHKEAKIHKARLDGTCGDLKDLKAAFDCIVKESNATQILALASEKNFVWNQFKNLEEKLNSKKNEIELANEEISRLREDVEQLSSSNYEKDSTIQGLKAGVNKLETALVEKSNEIELLRKAGNGSVTPLLRGCTVNTRKGDQSNNKNNNNMVNIESSSSRTHEKGTRSSKRKATGVIPLSETPQLFTSSFKVPKLKNPSPRVNSLI